MMEEETGLLEEGEILEVCDVPTVDQFSVSRATREPQTICSEESSNDNSEDSDDDSDTQCSKPKKVKAQPQLPVSRKQVPNKYKVWSIALQEETLTETLTKCDVEAIDRERSVESYNYRLSDKTDYSQFSGYRMPVSECHFLDSDYITCSDDKQYLVGSKRRHSDIKKRLGHKNSSRVRTLPSLDVTADDSAEEVAEDIAKKLRETKVDLILNVVLVLGREKAIALYNETKDVEDSGGMLLMNGERRRTPGGVFLLLLKRDDSISSDASREIFAEDAALYKRKRKKANKLRRKKRTEEIKETLIREKLLSLNTAAFVQGAESKTSDTPLENESNTLEEGEVEVEAELTVTNPPPSPATDQDTPPRDDDPTHAHTLGRAVINYEDNEEDYLDLDGDIDDMDVF